MDNKNNIEKLENKVDYYDRLSKKIWDFIVGLVCCFLIYAIFPMLYYMTIESIFGYWSSLVNILNIIMFFGAIYSIYYFFKIKRRFIAIGAIVAVVIPILAFGACVLVFSMGDHPW